MVPARPVGIVGYGAYIPAYRLPAQSISELWREGQDSDSLPIRQKSVPGPDEDTITIAIEASQNALSRAQIKPADIRAIWVGSESHPYAVKPSGTLLAQVLGIKPDTVSADLEFACKAGTEAMQAAIALVGSSMGRYALAVGADTAQGKPGDALEYTSAAAGAAFIFGPAQKAVAILEGSYSYVTDTPDFFRRAYQKYPEHGNRFTGDLAYFRHIRNSAQILMDGLHLQPSDFAAAVFHQPNVKFPRKIAKDLGFTHKQIEKGLLVDEIGNSYAASSVLGFCATLDKAQPGERILLVSFGSGAGSDAFSFIVGDKINLVRDMAPGTGDYVQRYTTISYDRYAKWRKKIVMK